VPVYPVYTPAEVFLANPSNREYSMGAHARTPNGSFAPIRKRQIP
jgi:hypothetical protein